MSALADLFLLTGLLWWALLALLALLAGLAAVIRRGARRPVVMSPNHPAVRAAMVRPGIRRLPPEPEEDINEVLRRWAEEGRGK